MKRIEAEKNELVLQNESGDYAIIPADKREEVQRLLSEGCYDCIDRIVESLPKASDYAQDGSLFPGWDKVKSTLNPYNWGVSDYTNKGDFDSAYSFARQSGEKEFIWNNKRYSTTAKNNPGEIIKKRDDFEPTIFSTHPEITERANAISYGGLGDLYNYYVGNPLTKNSLYISEYKPTISSENARYISIKDEKFDEEVLKNANRLFINNDVQGKKDIFLTGDEKINEHSYKTSGYDYSKGVYTDHRSNAIGRYIISKGNDDRGDYISYYDVFDKASGKAGTDIIEKLGLAKPFEIYNRIYFKDYGDGVIKKMYYSDKELIDLDIDKKNFDTLALQRELSNRGYKLSKSTKKDNSFDGVWGDETKAALLDYQSKSNKIKAEDGLVISNSDPYNEPIQALLDKYNSPMTVNDFASVSKETGIGVDALLTQALLESSLGTKGKGARSNNPLNWGNDDEGNIRSYGTYREGLLTAAKGLKEKFYFTTPEDFMERNFQGKYGIYATDPEYKTKYNKYLNFVRKNVNFQQPVEEPVVEKAAAQSKEQPAKEVSQALSYDDPIKLAEQLPITQNMSNEMPAISQEYLQDKKSEPEITDKDIEYAKAIIARENKVKDKDLKYLPLQVLIKTLGKRNNKYSMLSNNPAFLSLLENKIKNGL